MLNRFYLSIVVCLGVCFVLPAFAVDPPEPVTITLEDASDDPSNPTKAIINNYGQAETWYDRTNRFLNTRNAEMDRLNNDLKIINYGIQNKRTELEDAVINGLGAIFDGSNGSILASTILTLRKNRQLWEIKKSKIEKLVDIADLQPSVDASARDRDAVYEVFKKWWNYQHPSGSGGSVPKRGASPIQVSVSLPLTLECKNGCGKEYSSAEYDIGKLALYAEHFHQVACQIPHRINYWSGNVINHATGKKLSSTTESYVYYRCSSYGDGYNYFTECRLESFHFKKCKYHSQCNGWYASGGRMYAHITYCDEPVEKSRWNKEGNCRGWYYHCVSETSADCWKADEHLPDTRPCGHLGSASGRHSAASCGIANHFVCDNRDHSAASCGTDGHNNCDGLNHVEAQCSETNGNGDQCTYTYWECLNVGRPTHAHTYPTPPPAPEPEPDPEPEPEPERLTCRFCQRTWDADDPRPRCRKKWRRDRGYRCRSE